MPADIFVRFHRLRGDQVIHVGATDDFGTPILVEAERRGIKPEEFAAFWNQTDSRDYADVGISFDIFYKTSSKENMELTQYFFRKLYDKGYIYKRLVLQPYCETCKKSLPDRYVKGTCPKCGAVDQYSDSCEHCGRTFEPSEILDPHCSICGSKPVNRESQHYFFKLTEFSSALEKWLAQNENLQPEVKNYVLNWVKEGLRDWDVSRDIPWGVPIPLPEAEGKVFYVWFDNHIAYISIALKYFAERGIDGKEEWNASKIYHFIGKDIVYHHYLFLPAMRLGVGEYKLPEFIPTRGYFLLEGQKFSKSRGWYVSLHEFLKKFPPDYLRFYLAAITPYSQLDVNFSWEDFKNRINNELIANVGNFIHRTLTFIWVNYEGKVPKPQTYGDLDKEFEQNIREIASNVAAQIENNELSRGLKTILEFSSFCNQYFQKKQPWKDKANAETSLYICANAVRTLAILLEPYIPFSADSLWQQLNLDGSVHKQQWNSASKLSMPEGHRINRPKTLFQKIQTEEIDRLRSLESSSKRPESTVLHRP